MSGRTDFRAVSRNDPRRVRDEARPNGLPAQIDALRGVLERLDTEITRAVERRGSAQVKE